MSAPQKPWERPGVNSQNFNTSMSNSMASFPETSMPSPSLGEVPPCCRPTPPPVPNRPSQASAVSSYGGGYGSSFGYGGYGSGMYSPYGGGLGGMYGGGMYGGFGGGGMYGGMYNRLGGPNENYNTNSFVQQAEQSSRQAFQSVESVVQAFGSIAMMLDSTFYAVYNSFRAVLGVADQFSRVRAHLGQILSALAVIRTLRWLWRKLLVLLRLRQSGLPEDAWSQAAEEGMKAVLSEQDLKAGGPGGSSWPIFLFFAIIFGGPWILWKLLSRINGETGGQDWMSGADEHYGAVAEYDFVGDAPDELSFKKGQRIVIAPKELQPRMRGWLLGSVDGKKTGIIPANYVKILGKRKGTKNVQHPTPKAPCCSQQKEIGVSAAKPEPNSFELDEHFPKTENTCHGNTNQTSQLENSFNQSNRSSSSLTGENYTNSIGIEEKSAADILDSSSNNEHGTS